MKVKWFFILSIIMCVFVLTACSSNDGGKSPDNSTQNQNETTTTQTETVYNVDVPDTNMEGKTFNFYGQNWYSYQPLSISDIYTEELSGDTLNDAVYNRNLLIEQKFNCNVTMYTIEDPDEGYKKVIASIMAGDNVYDIMLMRGHQYNKLLLSGGLTELTNIPYLNFDNPWWDSNSFDELAIKNKKYVVVSDITMNNYLSIFCIYFNKDMINDFNMEDPYELVNSGKWTLDQFYYMAEQVPADLDGNDKRDTNDRYGFTYVSDMPEGLLNASGVRLATLDEDGIPVLTALDEGSISKMQKIYTLFEDLNVSLNCHKRSSNAFVDETGMFMNNQVLFSLGGIYYASEMRQMESDFGIIPYPKYDEQQETYNVPMLGNCVTYTVVPVTNPDLENTGIFMEYYAYLGYQELLPALYDVLLQGKVARDEESSAMLDFIFNNSFYDTGMICDFGGMRNTIRDLYLSFKGTFASSLAAIEEKIQLNIDELVAEMG